MGAEQSKQDDQEQRKKNQEESSIGSGAALAVGAAVGTAILAGVALYRYRSSVSDNRVNQTRDQSHILESHHKFQGVEQYDYEGSDLRYESYIHEGRPYKSSTSNRAISLPKTSVKIMSYNVWSQEKYELITRMGAIGRLVEDHSPHFICFQEITPTIYNYFSKSSWWKDYHCSMSVEEANDKQYFCILLSTFVPVNTIKEPLGYNSKVGREITIMETKVWGNRSLVIATSHLKSRCADPSVSSGQHQHQHHHQYKKVRIDQAKEALIMLKECPNIIFCGDMNWDEKVDGEFPLPEGWVDAWIELKPDQEGFTYDTLTNRMLSGHRQVRERFDRSLCNLNSFELEEIEIIGKDAIPGAMYNSNPVLPSDHYGLVLTIS